MVSSVCKDQLNEVFDYNEGYKYPHDYPGHWVEQQYLPDKMLGTKYFVKDENVKE